MRFTPRLVLSTLTILSFLLTLGAFAADPPLPDPDNPEAIASAREASVTVFGCNGGSGTGVFVRCKGHDLVWTAAHVVSDSQVAKTVVDPNTGQPKVSITYKDVRVMREVYQDGRKVGEDTRLAEVLRYSDVVHGGLDLALLRVYDTGFAKRGVEFILPATRPPELPKPGTRIFHIGSMQGIAGALNLSEGVFSIAGRLRGPNFGHEELNSPRTLDGVTLHGAPGSSGGGVFLKSDGRCIGLLTECLVPGNQGALLVVPSRAIYAYVKKANCLWAYYPGAYESGVPEEELRKNVTDCPVPLPDDFPGKPQAQPHIFYPRLPSRGYITETFDIERR